VAPGHPVTDEAEAHRIARAALAGLIELEQDGPVTVQRRGRHWVVEFGYENPPGVRGPDFEARVTLDADTGEVVEVLAGS
jgi:hypothetical protein